MGAYGHVPAPSRSGEALKPRLYASRKAGTQVVCVPFNAQELAPPKELVELMAKTFNEELERGITYPQRGPMGLSEFEGYFLAYDCVVGVLISSDGASSLELPTPDADGSEVTHQQVGLSSLSDVDWSTRYAFSYYIKPNYPGRSSHLCNAGFIVPLTSRGLGLGSLAGLSFTHYGPAAGYRGSVFNLVYASNVASVRIWQALGFDNVGLIPGAGLLKKGDEEVYTDAWVVHGDFEKIAKLKKERAAAVADKAAQIAAETKAVV